MVEAIEQERDWQVKHDMDARQVPGESPGTNKAIDLAGIQSEIRRKRAMVLALSQKSRELEIAGLEAKRALLFKER